MKKTITFILLLTAYCLQAQTTNTITPEVLKDKIAGGWAGKMIGVTYGAPTEFRFQQAINTDPINWKPEDIKGSIWQDDIYVQLTFLMAMDKHGVDAPAIKFQEMLATAGYPLWCANMQARKNFFDGIYPPASGSPEYSFRADDIDFQIEADYIGFMNPGMTQNVVDIAGKIGHIMNYGDGVYGGIFLGAMYSAAYVESDMRKIVEVGLLAIPAESDYARIIRDVMKLYDHYPGDWKAAWKELDAKWGDVDISGAGSLFNIDAKINGAYIVMGLLYGEGDVYRTMEITTRCGQDSDCNPSSALAVLGVMRGFSHLPEEMQQDVKALGDSIFINTDYSFNKAVERTFDYAIRQIQENGGKVEDNKITFPVQQVAPAILEVSFPDVVYDTSISIFSGDKWKFNGRWKVFKEKTGDGHKTDQAKFSGKAGSELEFTFDGTGISLMGNWVRNGGQADIYLDGKLHRSFDTYYHYANQEHLNVSIWHVFQLKPGTHTVKVFVKGKKNELSEGANVYITQAIIYQTGLKKSDNYKFSFE